MEVLTINKTDIRDTERTINKAISKVKKNNFGDKVASRLILFIMAVIYLFLAYGTLWSTATPENQIFLEKAAFPKNLWVNFITGLEYEGDFVYALFGLTLVTLIAVVILFPFIRKFFKLFYIEKKTKNDTPHYNEDWKNLIELRYKLGNAFRESNLLEDAISAIGLYFFSSVILTSVYYFNCFSFGKAVSSVLIASVIGVFCYGIAVALFVLADALFYDSNEKLLYLKYDLDEWWFELVWGKVCFFESIHGIQDLIDKLPSKGLTDKQFDLELEKKLNECSSAKEVLTFIAMINSFLKSSYSSEIKNTLEKNKKKAFNKVYDSFFTEMLQMKSDLEKLSELFSEI